MVCLHAVTCGLMLCLHTVTSELIWSHSRADGSILSSTRLTSDPTLSFKGLKTFQRNREGPTLLCSPRPQSFAPLWVARASRLYAYCARSGDVQHAQARSGCRLYASC